MFLISWECFVYNGIHLYLILYIPRIHKYFISMTTQFNVIQLSFYIKITKNSFWVFVTIFLLNVLVYSIPSVLFLQIFESMNKSSYYKFFDSTFTYKKEFTLKYTMIDTQKESIYSRLHFFQRHLRGTMNWDKHFIFSNIITYWTRDIYCNDIRCVEFGNTSIFNCLIC